MNKSLKVGLIFIASILIITSILQVSQRPEINWIENLDRDSKTPFGLYILKEELPKWTNYKGEINQTLYEKIDKLDPKKSALFAIDNYDIFTEQGVESTLEFVDKGGTLFLSGKNFYQFEEELNLEIYSVNEFSNDYVFDHPYHQNQLIKGNHRYLIEEKGNYFDQTYLFVDFEKKVKAEILGYVQVNKEEKFPNFLKIKYGKGFVYYQIYPKAFTNYYLLNQDSYLYARESLTYLKDKEVYWFTEKSSEQSYNILRFVLSNKELAFAWRMLFACLIIFMVFRSKREQKAIEIVTPEPNLSVDFAKTIASLYYENGSVANMIQKKIEYFLFSIRKHFGVETDQLLDPKFIRLIANKANIKESEAKELVEKIVIYQTKENVSLNELKMMNELIENYKKKANII